MFWWGSKNCQRDFTFFNKLLFTAHPLTILCKQCVYSTGCYFKVALSCFPMSHSNKSIWLHCCLSVNTQADVWRVCSAVQRQHLGGVIELNLNIAQAQFQWLEERLMMVYVRIASFLLRAITCSCYWQQCQGTWREAYGQVLGSEILLKCGSVTYR